MTTTSSALAANDIGALLAQHPLGWWMAGAVAFALLGSAALTGLRSLRQHVGAPLGRVFPPQARWVLVAAMAASACTLVLAGATLAELAESGSTQGYWGALDDAVAASLQAQAPAAVLQWFATLTHLGDTWVLTALALGDQHLWVNKIDKPLQSALRIRIQASDVSLVLQPPLQTSIRNILRAKVAQCFDDNGQVEVQLEVGKIGRAHV